jgi:hypothetical protein
MEVRVVDHPLPGAIDQLTTTFTKFDRAKINVASI